MGQENAGEVLRDLGDELVMRRGMVSDAEPLAAFNADIHRGPGTAFAEAVGAWTRDLMLREHPTCGASDFTVVEDTRTGAIVSSMCLIPQTWSYEGIPFGVGRPELVGTHPDYRKRGLIRAQLDVLHQWSGERGERVQAITGIPYFYRQFGYEMGLEHGGGCVGYGPNMPKLKEGETESFGMRLATEADVPFMAGLCEQAGRRYLVTGLRDESLWRYELSGRSEGNLHRRELHIIETADGEAVGFLAHAPQLWQQAMAVFFYELRPGISWLAVTPRVMRYLWATGQAYAARDEDELSAISFWLGSAHPVFDVFSDRLPRVREPYAWYVRVPDLPGFLSHIAPVLEKRLAESLLVGHTGDLKLSFYRDGLRLVFEDGRMEAVEGWQEMPDDRGAAAVPDLTFLQVLFGYRSCSELWQTFTDCWVETDEARALLPVLFPKRASLVWGVA